MNAWEDAKGWPVGSEQWAQEWAQRLLSDQLKLAHNQLTGGGEFVTDPERMHDPVAAALLQAYALGVEAERERVRLLLFHNNNAT